MSIPAKNKASRSPAIRIVCFAGSFIYGFVKASLHALRTWLDLVPFMCSWDVFVIFLFADDPLALIESIQVAST